MSDKTPISWTGTYDPETGRLTPGATWPVVTGCFPASRGCDNCYSGILTSGRLAHIPAYAGLAVAGKFTGEVRLHEDRLDWPLHWRKPRKVFVCSMSDLFHPKVPDAFIAKVFAVMALAHQHTFQVLTKRAARLPHLLSSHEFRRAVQVEMMTRAGGTMPWLNWPLRNVWVGVSAEDQEQADIRIPQLLDTPAAVRFLSCEPLLGPIDLTRTSYRTGPASARIDWVIGGGESGRLDRIRPAEEAWFVDLLAQCQAAGVPYWHKQHGTLLARQLGLRASKGDDPAEWPTPFPQDFPTVKAVA